MKTLRHTSPLQWALIVHSNGTRFESHRFRIDFTGSTKDSGRSADFLRVSAGGEDAARRAMPTSGTATFRTGPFARSWIPCGAMDIGGQSVVGRSEMLPR